VISRRRLCIGCRWNIGYLSALVRLCWCVTALLANIRTTADHNTCTVNYTVHSEWPVSKVSKFTLKQSYVAASNLSTSRIAPIHQVQRAFSPGVLDHTNHESRLSGSQMANCTEFPRRVVELSKIIIIKLSHATNKQLRAVPCGEITWFSQKRYCIAVNGTYPMTQLRSVAYHMGSHSVSSHPTQVNTPRLNPSQTGRYSIYLPRRDGRLSWLIKAELTSVSGKVFT